MLKFCSLYSGSSGNSLLVQSKNTNLLIDAGVSCKKIEIALNSIGVLPESLNGILISHEHSDHVQSLGTLAKKYNLPVFVNQETLDNMPKQKDKIPEENITYFKTSNKFEINDLTIFPFPIPHDAANPCGFNIIKDDKKISIATDIGHISKQTLKHLENSLLILLESNYDPEVLKCAPYPYSLKNRIAGSNGHLSNEMAGKTISYLSKCGLKYAMLGHLSNHSNFPELAYKTVLEQLIQDNYDDSKLQVCVANRDNCSKIINI